jgi:hypothetical protein
VLLAADKAQPALLPALCAEQAAATQAELRSTAAAPSSALGAFPPWRLPAVLGAMLPAPAWQGQGQGQGSPVTQQPESSKQAGLIGQAQAVSRQGGGPPRCEAADADEGAAKPSSSGSRSKGQAGAAAAAAWGMLREQDVQLVLAVMLLHDAAPCGAIAPGFRAARARVAAPRHER